MTRIHSSVACNLEANILLASLPLFEAGKVGAIEWSFDALYKFREIPDWFHQLLQEFGKADRLIGHGVFFSLFSGKWAPEQQEWLAHLKRRCAEYRFDHITEHFGFMTGEDFHKGAPISIPFTAATLALGRDRLQRIAEACQRPVGLENLAFSYSLEEVKKHGEFLERLIEPVNGFIILDLHNLFCQLHNFDISFDDLSGLYPLHRVREIHISGGSWDDSAIVPGKKIRRDTHDEAVPAEVFRLLESVVDQCPNLQYVVLEQLGSGLQTEESREAFRQDFFKLDRIVQRKNASIERSGTNSFLPEILPALGDPVEAPLLYSQQLELSAILETAVDYEQARTLLTGSGLAHTDWEIERWQPCMVETARKIARKWKNGFV